MTYSRFVFSLICVGTILLLITVAQESLAGDITTGWSFEKSLRENFKNYGYQVVNKPQKFLVVKQSIKHPMSNGRVNYYFLIQESR